MRPEDAAAREVPVPQAAAAAVERGVDAAAHRVVDQVGFARARRLPVEGEAEDQHDEAGGGGERDGQRGVGAPGRERVAARLDDRELAVRRAAGCAPWRSAGVPSASGISSTPAAAPKVVSGCVGPSTSISRRPIDRRRRAAAAAMTVPSALLTSTMRQPATIDAVGVGDQHLASGHARPGRHHALELACSGARAGSASRARTVEPLGEQIGDGLDLLDELGDRLAAMIEHLHERADADGEQEGDDQRRDRAPQSRLGGEQPPIRGLGDRLRQSLDRIRAYGRTRRPRRAPCAGLRSDIPNTFDRKDVPHLSESLSIGIERWRFVESAGQ